MNDQYLSQSQVDRTIAEYMLGQCQLQGGNVESMRARLGGGERGSLLSFLQSVQVTREKHAGQYESTPQQTTARDSMERLKGLPEAVRSTIAQNRVVEGDTVQRMREWQTLVGDRSLGLLLVGGAGVGKSLHAALLLRGNTLEAEPEGWIIGESVLSMHLGSGTKSDKEAALAPLRATPLIVVDYMGQRKVQPGWDAAIIEFLRLRWESGKRCVLTFRGNVASFQQTYGADGWATVERFCSVITVRRDA